MHVVDTILLIILLILCIVSCVLSTITTIEIDETDKCKGTSHGKQAKSVSMYSAIAAGIVSALIIAMIVIYLVVAYKRHKSGHKSHSSSLPIGALMDL